MNCSCVSYFRFVLQKDHPFRITGLYKTLSGFLPFKVIKMNSETLELAFFPLALSLYNRDNRGVLTETRLLLNNCPVILHHAT